MPKQKSPFTQKTYRFLSELEKNNNREWFKANKDRYERDVKEPMLEFIASMQKSLGKISRYIVADPSPSGGSMFRIYRDTRFATDKTPYKTHVAAQFRHKAGRDAHAPGFYVHIGTDENIVGGGIWHPGSPALALIRARIDARIKDWEKVITNKKFREVLGDVGGDKLVRPPRGYDPMHQYVEHLKHKDYVCGVNFLRRRVMMSSFQDEVAETFNAAAPLMKFLCDALGLPW